MWRIAVCVFILLSSAKAQNFGDCHLDDVTKDWTFGFTNEEVDDTERVLFKKFAYKNIKSVKQSEKLSNHIYFNVFMDEDYVWVEPTSEFEKYEVNEASVEKPQMETDLEFICQDGTEAFLRFKQPINDINTYEPIFNKDSYTFHLPMPLPKDFDIGIFGEHIEACDDDISNIILDFSIEPFDDFQIKWEEVVPDSKNKCHKAKVTTTERFIDGSNTTYTITVTDRGKPAPFSTTALLKIEIDELNSIPPNPHFKNAYYEGIYNDKNEKHSVDLEASIELSDKCSDKHTLNLEGDYASKFSVKCSESGNIILNLDANLDDKVLEEETVVLLTISAEIDHANGPGRTVVIIYPPKQECPEITTEAPATCPTTPTDCSECPCSMTTVCPIAPTDTPTKCPPCPTEDPSVTQCPTPPTECPTECPSCPTECPEATECPTTPTDCPTECTPCSTESPEVTECPTTPTDCPTECTPCPTQCPEVTECPTTPTDWPTECTPCPTEIPCATDCPPCSSTIEPPPIPTIIYFTQNKYEFNTQKWYVGEVIGAVNAVAIPSEDIEYDLEGDDFVKINKDTGAIEMVKEKPPGEYEYKAIAKGVKTNTKTTAPVTIRVLKEDTENPQSKYSILVEHIEEDHVASIKLPCQYTYCKYSGAGHPLFNYTITDNILNLPEIKRESKDFESMLVPQISLELFLSETGTLLTQDTQTDSFKIQTHDQETPEGWEWVFIPENILNVPQKLWLNVILDDINNNPPVFEVEELIVGYPKGDLVEELAPPYLAQVKATDKDEGLNAKIRYSTDNEFFFIHPHTGVLYPKETLFDQDTTFKFKVTATDRDGADDGISTDMNIEVVPLKKEHLLVLVMKNVLLEDIDGVMEELSKATNKEINYISAAVVPQSQSSYLFRYFKKEEYTYYSKIIMYGLNSEKEAIKNDDLKDILEDTENIIDDFTAEEYKDKVSTRYENRSVAGYIAAVATLASLLILLLVAAAIFYYFKIYKPKKQGPYTGPDEDQSSIDTETKSDVFLYERREADLAPPTETNETNVQRRPTGFVFNPPPVEDEDQNPFQRRATGFVFNPPPDEENEARNPNLSNFLLSSATLQEESKTFGEQILDNRRKIVHNESGLSQSDEDIIFGKEDSSADSPDGKKSVKFKETVQKINIPVEDKDEDVFDERL